jgi:hypothetical protein
VRLPAFLAGLALAAGLLAAPAAAQVEVVSARPDKVAVVVYREGGGVRTAELYAADDRPFDASDNSGLVLVTETRTIDLPAGRSRIRFRGVAEGMLPQSAELEGLPGGIERNYDFDLLTPAALIERAVGERVRRVRTNPENGAVTEERATLRSGPRGVVLDIAGRIEALGCSGGPERLVFDRVPPGLADTPTLSVLVDSTSGGRRTVKLSYLALGVQWSADYVATLSPDGRTLDLLGWITLSNRTRTTFADAPTQVVAGNLNREPALAPRADAPVREPNCWPMDTTTDIEGAPPLPPMMAPPPPPPPAPVALMEVSREAIVVTGSRVRRALATQSNLADYKLYTLPEPTTVAARQTKQVAFLDEVGIPVERLYAFQVRETGDAVPATLRVRFRNTAAGGLGKPLPGGTVSVLAPGSNGRMALVGQDAPEDLPVGFPVELDIGQSVDVSVRTEAARVKDGEAQPFAVEAANAGTEPAIIEIAHPTGGQAFTVSAEDRPHTVRDGEPVWRFTVPANGRATLRYTVRVGSS